MYIRLSRYLSICRHACKGNSLAGRVHFLHSGKIKKCIIECILAFSEPAIGVTEKFYFNLTNSLQHKTIYDTNIFMMINQPLCQLKTKVHKMDEKYDKMFLKIPQINVGIPYINICIS